jgi:hypothetical protein
MWHILNFSEFLKTFGGSVMKIWFFIVALFIGITVQCQASIIQVDAIATFLENSVLGEGYPLFDGFMEGDTASLHLEYNPDLMSSYSNEPSSDAWVRGSTSGNAINEFQLTIERQGEIVASYDNLEDLMFQETVAYIHSDENILPQPLEEESTVYLFAFSAFDQDLAAMDFPGWRMELSFHMSKYENTYTEVPYYPDIVLDPLNYDYGEIGIRYFNWTSEYSYNSFDATEFVVEEVTVIPEPCSLLLFAVGGILLSKRRNKRHN